MSLAIGTWLYDASAEYSTSSKKINSAILNAFSVRKNQYNNTPDQVLNEVNSLPVFLPSQGNKNDIKEKNKIKNNLKKSNIPNDMLWVLK